MRAVHPNVKMIEIKLSQGAKPGHGGILPAAKVTAETSEIRGVPMERVSFRRRFTLRFLLRLAYWHSSSNCETSAVGSRLGLSCASGGVASFSRFAKRWSRPESLPTSLRLMVAKVGPVRHRWSFSNHIGAPLIEGLIFVHNALVGYSLRSNIKIFASGKVASGFAILKRVAIGADVIMSARAMMMAIGCIQALKCNSNHCPVGVATQDEYLMAGLDPTDKSVYVASYHKQTIYRLAEMLRALGLDSAQDLRPWHLMHRVSATETRH